MNHAFKLGDVSASCKDLAGTVVSVAGTRVELLIQTVGSVNESLSLLVKNSNSGVLSEAFLLPFRKSTVILING